MDPLDVASVKEAMVEAVGGRKAYDIDYRIIRPDGSKGIVHAQAEVTFDGLGKPVMMFGTVQDITERKQMEEQMVRSRRLEMAGQIAGQVAHDFNNLLTPMTAYPELLRMELPSGHPAIRYIDQIENAAWQMAAINEDLLTLSRRGRLDQAPVVLNDLVQQAMAQMPPAPDTFVIQLELAADLLPVNGSAAQLVRVIANLVGNARDAMSDAGSLCIETTNVYLDEDRPGYDRLNVGEYVRLQIQDTGCGISIETKEKIFEPFFSTKSADRRRGSGLGLSIVQSIVQDHGGLVDVASEVGVGTSFSLYFPICREAVKVGPIVDVQGGSECVLIVDDDLGAVRQ